MITIDKEDGVAVLTLNRPEAMNALSKALRRALYDGLKALEADPEVRVIILTGAGDRAFTAGLDLKELGSDPGGMSAANAASADANPVKAIETCSKPVIGAINGVAITGGFEVALACDILIASERARFADTHARVGILPGWGLSQKLSRLIGVYRAKELSLIGNFIDAKTAEAWGLVNRVVAHEDLLPQARRRADSRDDCTAGTASPTSAATTVITARTSTSVKPGSKRLCACGGGILPRTRGGG
jgi:enoyl-CoA hydratase